MLGSANNVFPLVSDFFYYLPTEPGATPTVIPTGSPTATPTATPLACAERVSNGGFEATASLDLPQHGQSGQLHHRRPSRICTSACCRACRSANPPAQRDCPTATCWARLAPAGAVFSSGYQTISIPGQCHAGHAHVLVQARHRRSSQRLPARAASGPRHLCSHQDAAQGGRERPGLDAAGRRSDRVPRPERGALLRGVQQQHRQHGAHVDGPG